MAPGDGPRQGGGGGRGGDSASMRSASKNPNQMMMSPSDIEGESRVDCKVETILEENCDQEQSSRAIELRVKVPKQTHKTPRGAEEEDTQSCEDGEEWREGVVFFGLMN